MPTLNPKQQRFCEEYVIDLNATQAAIRAGYSEKTAYSIGQENLKKPEIEKYISVLHKSLQESTKISAEMVIAEFAKIGFANIQDFVNGGNSILELKHLDRNKVAAVSSIKTTVKNDGDTQTEIRFHNKVQALESLGKHLGIFKEDNEQGKSLTLNLSKESVKEISKHLENDV